MKPATYAKLAALLFAAQAIFAVVHRLVGGEYRGFTHVHNVVIDILLAVIWTAATVTALMRRPPKAGVLLVLGAIASLMHGLMFNLTSADEGPRGAGIPFLLAAIVESLFIVRAAPAFQVVGRETPEARREEPRHRHFFPLRPRHTH
jgi:hypothetical protein